MMHHTHTHTQHTTTPTRQHNASLSAPTHARQQRPPPHVQRSPASVLHQHPSSRVVAATRARSGSSSPAAVSAAADHADAASQEQPSTSGRPADSNDTPPSATSQQQGLVTFDEVVGIAAARGLHLSLKSLGPFYRITCRDGGPEGKIVGVTNGFVAPWFGLMHCDTLQIFTQGLKGAEGERLRRNPLGLGLLLGGAVFSYGLSCGCSKAEILAINDDDAWHERLVRYYTYFGFTPVCKVGGQGFLKDVPHLLVWGGEGMRMDADMTQALQRWTPALRQSKQKKQKPGQREAEAAS